MIINMKKLLFIILLHFSLFGISQNTDTSYYLKNYTDSSLMMLKIGSCASPNGPMNSTIITPPSYAWLSTNGYCNPGAYGTSETVCWTFTPTSTSVTINSGYSQTGCANVAFGGFNLYDGSCTLIATGLTFTGLTIGANYTWCMTGNAWGGGPGCIGFTNFCPYYFNNSMLPVELIEFRVIKNESENTLKWSTLSETNNAQFIIEKSINGLDWVEIYSTLGQGNSSTTSHYNYIDNHVLPTLNYYKLIQIDYDGETEELGIISVDNSFNEPRLIKITNIMGQEVDEDYQGLKLYIYENGDILIIKKQ